MNSFAQLLSRHMRRAGISDAELARAIGIRRQTIFRWKEGLTSRPRHRDDVLRCAAKLRLAPQERDELLLAAGFRPEAIPSPTAEPLAVVPPSPVPLESMRKRWWAIAAALLVLATVIALFVLVERDGSGQMRLSWPGWELPAVATAEVGETLVIVSQFANYASQRMGYNVAGRIREALLEDFSGAGLTGSRVAIWQQPVLNREEALQVGWAHEATLVIWGEYDSGRVLVTFTLPASEEAQATAQVLNQVTTPADLSAVINTELPTDVRWMALVSLGQLHYSAKRYDQAQAALERALAYPPQDESALAGVYFSLAYIYGLQSDLDGALSYYTQAIEHQPSLVSAYNNRGAAYLSRREEGDLQRAISDFDQAIELVPDFESAWYNRGMSYMMLGEAYDEQALADLRRARALQPNEAGPNNALCWQLSLVGRPEEALAYCDTAVATDPTAYSRDSRGLAYALLGRTEEAIAEFEAFVAWMEEQPEEPDPHSALRQEWIEALRAGRNPFDEETLRALRND
jgi:tetratricopeptide (TPR) repeat protein/DNA-binding XRE family transcriptional regulator